MKLVWLFFSFFSGIYNIIEPQETSFLSWKCHNYEFHLSKKITWNNFHTDSFSTWH